MTGVCFGVEGFLINVVIVVLVIAILLAVIQFAVPALKLEGPTATLVVTIIRYVILAVVLIFVIRLCFDLYSCAGAFYSPRLR